MSEPKFVPKKGQVDYTHIRYAPVMNIVVRHGGKILIVQRSSGMRLYPNHWNGISGFLDDTKDFEEKVMEELFEEVGITGADVVSLTRGTIFHQDAPEYLKTWIVHPVLVEVSIDRVKLDWEAQKYEWVAPEDALDFQLLPGFDMVLEKLFGAGKEDDWEDIKSRMTKSS